jgi:hypothetical protein
MCQRLATTVAILYILNLHILKKTISAIRDSASMHP